MLINEIKETTPNKNKKRVGRGGKRGTYSGRGLKGQSSRAGNSKRPAERDLIQRLPKLRGITNKGNTRLVININVGKLEELGIKDLNMETLTAKGLVPKSSRRPMVKILGQGEIKTPIKIIGCQVSKTAKEKIEAAGGSVIEK